MGWTLTGVQFVRNGQTTVAFADGNNVAWCCDKKGCGRPLLLTYVEGRIGSHPTRPTTCPGCKTDYSLSPP